MGRRGGVRAFVILLVFGALGIFRIIDNPRLKQVHGSDIVHLVGSGMCFGAAFGILFASRRYPGESN